MSHEALMQSSNTKREGAPPQLPRQPAQSLGPHQGCCNVLIKVQGMMGIFCSASAGCCMQAFPAEFRWISTISHRLSTSLQEQNFCFDTITIQWFQNVTSWHWRTANIFSNHIKGSVFVSNTSSPTMMTNRPVIRCCQDDSKHAELVFCNITQPLSRHYASG